MSRAVSSTITTEQLGYLGLIAGMINELDLVKKLISDDRYLSARCTLNDGATGSSDDY